MVKAPKKQSETTQKALGKHSKKHGDKLGNSALFIGILVKTTKKALKTTRKPFKRIREVFTKKHAKHTGERRNKVLEITQKIALSALETHREIAQKALKKQSKSGVFIHDVSIYTGKILLNPRGGINWKKHEMSLKKH